MHGSDYKLDAITEVSRRRSVVNAAASYGGHAIRFGVGLLLTAYVIRTLGKEQYALWPLIGTCTAVVALLPQGIGSGVGRFLAHALGGKRLEEVEQITSSAFAALVVAAVAYAGCAIALSVTFERLFDIPPGAAGVGPWAMLLAGLAGALRMPFGVFQGGLRAAQCFVVTNAIRVAAFLLQAGLTVLVFNVFAPSLIGIAAVFFVVQIVSALVTWWAARRAVPWQRVRWRSVDRKVLWRVTNFSFWVLVSSVAALLYWQTDYVVINKLLDPTCVTGYAVVVALVLAGYHLTQLGCSVLGPAVTVMHAQGDVPRIERAIYRANRAMVPVGSFPIVFAMVFGREILRVYVGAAYEPYAELFWFLGAGHLLCITHCSAGHVPVAFGRMALPSLAALAAAGANVALSIVLVAKLGWGLRGVACGTLAAWVVYKTTFWTWLVARMLQVSAWRYFVRGTLAPLANALPGAAALAVMRAMGLGHGLTGLIGVFALAGLVQAAAMLTWGLHRSDRERAVGFLKSLFRTLQLRWAT